MLGRLSIALLIFGTPALAQNKAAAPPVTTIEMTTPSFEMFRLVPGKTEAFMRSLAEWDKANVAGGQPPTQPFVHAGGEGWDVLLFKPARR